MLPIVIALGACAATTAFPLPERDVIARQVLAHPLDASLACLKRALATAPTVTGITPTPLALPLAQGVRVEQWFITPNTHQRVTYELQPLGTQETSIVIGLLQQHGQYERAGFADAARAALKPCV